ncbi:MAG: hypothetical protein WCR42_07315 [bacterium]
MQKYLFLIILANFLFTSCVEGPIKPTVNTNAEGDVIVLSEGLLGRSNSQLTLINSQNKDIIPDYYTNKNTGLKLGDTANDLVVFGDTAFIAVTGSGTIEAVSLITGKSLGRIYIPNSSPRQIAIVSDSVAYCTDLYRQILIKFNPRKIQLLEQLPDLCFYPEGIAYFEGKLYVANSGLGIFYKNNPLAGTLAVIDQKSEMLEKNIPIGKNLTEIVINQNVRSLYLCYYNTYEKDSIGGIVEFDIQTQKEKRRIKGHFRSMVLSLKNNKLFAVNQVPPKTTGTAVDGIVSLSLDSQDSEIKTIFKNDKKGEFWYSININLQEDQIWIGNAKNFQMDGEILVYSIFNKSVIGKYSTGINPNTILFMQK